MPGSAPQGTHGIDHGQVPWLDSGEERQATYKETRERLGDKDDACE